MKPLEKFRKDVLVMSGLSQHDVGIGGPDGPGDHARAVGTYLTGHRIRKTQGADIEAGVSVDQLAARAFAGKTRLPSLEVTCEDNYACLLYTSILAELLQRLHDALIFEVGAGGGGKPGVRHDSGGGVDVHHAQRRRVRGAGEGGEHGVEERQGDGGACAP